MPKWSERETVKFVQEYVSHKDLWDLTCKNYKNKHARVILYSKIIDAMNISGFGQKEVMQKIKNIRSTYAQELKKIAESKKSKDGIIYTPAVKWFPIMHNALKKVAPATSHPQTNEVSLAMPLGCRLRRPVIKQLRQ